MGVIVVLHWMSQFRLLIVYTLWTRFNRSCTYIIQFMTTVFYLWGNDGLSIGITFDAIYIGCDVMHLTQFSTFLGVYLIISQWVKFTNGWCCLHHGTTFQYSATKSKNFMILNNKLFSKNTSDTTYHFPATGQGVSISNQQHQHQQNQTISATCLIVTHLS